MAIDSEPRSVSARWRDHPSPAVCAAIAATFAQTFGVGSIVEIGCESGALAEALRACGYQASHCPIGDFSAAYTVDLPPAEYVCALEIAEHLPPACAPGFVASLTASGPRRILFTAAPTGQAGEGHVHCRPFSYWISLFVAHGYALDLAGSCRVRTQFRQRRGAGVPPGHVNNFLTFCPASTMGPSAEDSGEARAILQDELTSQRAALDYLSHRIASVVELSALLRRALGEPTELSEEDARQLRRLAY